MTPPSPRTLKVSHSQGYNVATYAIASPLVTAPQQFTCCMTLVLLRSDPNQHLAGNLKAVRPFKPLKLFRDLCPGPFMV
jgi:hypothetical protein